MSEAKRVHFETESSGSKKLSSIENVKEKTFRLELKLFEPNADSFPQFNFKKLCEAEKVSDRFQNSYAYSPSIDRKRRRN